jgi:hypothetical protein
MSKSHVAAHAISVCKQSITRTLPIDGPITTVVRLQSITVTSPVTHGNTKTQSSHPRIVTVRA